MTSGEIVTQEPTVVNKAIKLRKEYPQPLFINVKKYEMKKKRTVIEAEFRNRKFFLILMFCLALITDEILFFALIHRKAINLYSNSFYAQFYITLLFLDKIFKTS